MTSKSLLAAVAVLAVPSLAFAAGDRDAKVEWKVGATPDASAQRSPTAAAAAPVARDSGRINASQKELQVVAEAAKAKSEKDAFKQTSVPGSQSGAKASKGQSTLVRNAQMKVVGEAMKAKAATNGGAGKPSEQPQAGGSSGAAPSARPAAETKVVASAMKVKAQKNASGRPSETPRAQGSFGGRSSFGGRAPSFGGRGGSPVGARASFGRMPAERGSHCNARGMCF
ncbi:MAG TPA: hypothetical protein VMB50_17345 [Myxococcales bacterium]|nr:hypothetical protein [Myxococcales bacterium]